MPEQAAEKEQKDTKEAKEIKEPTKVLENQKNSKSVWGKETNAIEVDLKTTSEEERQKLLQMSEISIWLDTYDDIFSDFDPRPYSQRALSDDFLSEAKKVSKEKKSGTIELKLMIPINMRNTTQEQVIKKRLREHFKKHYDILEKEVRNTKKKAFGIVALGSCMIMATTYVTMLSENFFTHMLEVVLEPGGWFTTWTGLEQIFFGVEQKKQDLDFYEKMAKCQITFTVIN